jgi:cell division protein ZapA
MKGPIEVEIFGQTFILTSDDEAEYVKKMAAYVDQKMQQVAATTKTVATLRIAILTALNIADEYHKARRQEEEVYSQIDSLSASLLERISQIEGKPHLIPADEKAELGEPQVKMIPKRIPSSV